MNKATVWLMTCLAISLLLIFGTSPQRGLDVAQEVIAQTPLQTNPTAAQRASSSATHFVESGAAWGLRDNGGDLYGISVADYDDDHDDDLYIGWHAEAPILFENNGAKSFVERTSRIALITDNNDFRDRHIAAFADYDGDDDLDLAIITGAVFGSCCGHDQLYRNGPAPWPDLAEGLGIRDSDGSGRYGLWFDYDNDGDLDLFVGHVVYTDTPEKNHNLLYDSNSWRNVAAQVGLDYLDNSGTALAADIDDDHDLDLILTPKYARPSGEPPQPLKFYRNEVKNTGKFERIECDSSTTDYVTIAAGDVDNDGDADLVFGRLNNAAEIWVNPGAKSNPCTWQRRMLGASSRNATALVLMDFDNDGDLDFYFGRQNQLGTAPATILLSANGVSVSEDTSAGVALWSRSAELQATWGDFNRDGWVDLVCGGPQVEGFRHAALLLNNYKADFSNNRSITLRLKYDRPGGKNRAAIGSRVRIATLDKFWTRWVDSGGSWHASLPHYVHAGVGAAQQVNVQVDWPDGTRTSLNGLATNECWQVQYSTGAATKCKPPVATSVSSNEAAPIAFNLAQNYPNPFSANGRGTFGNPSTVISFQLPVNSYVTLKVFDVTGREVARLVEGEMAAGTHAIRFAANGLANGLYFYQIKAGNFRQQKKMIVAE
jgi:hypothetical protein